MPQEQLQGTTNDSCKVTSTAEATRTTMTLKATNKHKQHMVTRADRRPAPSTQGLRWQNTPKKDREVLSHVGAWAVPRILPRICAWLCLPPPPYVFISLLAADPVHDMRRLAKVTILLSPNKRQTGTQSRWHLGFALYHDFACHHHRRYALPAAAPVCMHFLACRPRSKPRVDRNASQ